MRLLSCPSCGKKILDEEAPYCPYCRKELRLTPTTPIKSKAEQEKYWICPSCKSINSPEQTVCHNCTKPFSLTGYETHTSYHRYEKPSAMWYLVAFLLGLVGGLIAYVAIKDEDPSMGNTCLALGFLTTLFGVAIIWFYLPIF
jgi:predicted amidophosphoribosyltransferase